MKINKGLVYSALLAPCLPSYLSAQAVVPIPLGWLPSTPSPSSPSSRRFVLPQSNIASALNNKAPLLQWGQLSGSLDLSYLFAQDEGLFNAGRRITSSMQTVSAETNLAYGPHWSGEYTHSRSYFSNEELQSTTDDSASIKGQYTSQEWAWSLGATYVFDFRNLSETGSQTKRRIVSYDASGSTVFGSRTMASVSLGFSSRNADAPAFSATSWQVADYNSWSSTQTLNYRLTRKLTIGSSATEGYDIITPGDNSNSYSINVQTTWQPSGRINMSGSVGRKYWRFTTASAKPTTNLVYNANLAYQLTSTTSLTVGANQGIAPSYFANQATEATGVNAGLEQRLLTRLFITLSAQSFRTSYFATSGTLPSRRVDKGEGLLANLSVPILGRGSFSVFFSQGRNTSSDSQFNFGKTQRYGLQLSAKL